MTAATDPSVAAVIVVAAGSGQRLGAAVPKAFVEVAGRTLLAHSLSLFGGHALIRDVVAVVPADRAGAPLPGVRVVAGGATRRDSVAAGLAVLADDVRIVLVHDAARPFVPAQVVRAVVEAVRAGADAAVPVVPVHDTIRRVTGSGELAGVVDRASLVAVQTPQGFARAALLAAHATAPELTVTDDAALVEAAGGTVVAVPGSEDGFKVTTQADLARAEALARLRSAQAVL